MKVWLCTFGCQMNEYDSELVRAIMTGAGYAFTDDEAEADIIMLNTCSVRDNAHRKVYGNIHEIRHRRQGGRPFLIGILGCMATGLRQELLDNRELALDFVVGPDSYKRLPEILDNIQKAGKVDKVFRSKKNQGPSDLAGPEDLTDLSARHPGYDVTLSESETYSDVYPARTPGVNAWVAVMRGCNNFCSFCIVPYTRGRERSRPVGNIVEEVRRLAAEGFPQVTLLGQNVNSYKHDGQDFAGLLEAVSRVEGIRRIRFTAPHPKDFPDSLIRVVAENPKVCKQIHLPLQAGGDRVLALMNRHYTGAEFLALVEKIRSACPQVALSTDVIVGFPSETAAEFEDTMRVMRAAAFDSAFIFKYSPRPQTKAARELRDDVPEEEKTVRIVRLNVLQAEISLRKNQAAVGGVQEVLIEEADAAQGGTAWGRNDANKVVTLPKGDLRPGRFVRARIVRATPHQLKGEPA